MKKLAFDWNELKFFLATARGGGLSGAAAMLGSSASTVSRHIDALERRVGRTLFLRQQNGYLLTDDGSALLAQAEQVAQAIAVAERTAEHEEVAGVVRLATTEMLAQHLVVPNLPAFRARYPALRVELDIAMEAVNLSRRDADLALRMAPPDDGSGDYIARRVGKVDFAVYVALGDPGARGLDYVSWDGAWEGLPMAKSMRSAFGGKPPVLACNSLPAQIAAVRAGVGAGMLPCFIGDADSALRRMDGGAAPVSRDLGLVYHRDLKASLRVAAMRDFITGLIGTLAPASAFPR